MCLKAGSVDCGDPLCRESESDLHAVDGDGRVAISRTLHLERRVLCRVRATGGQRQGAAITDKVRVVSGGGVFDAVRRMVSGCGAAGGSRGGFPPFCKGSEKSGTRVFCFWVSS